MNALMHAQILHDARLQVDSAYSEIEYECVDISNGVLTFNAFYEGGLLAYVKWQSSPEPKLTITDVNGREYQTLDTLFKVCVEGAKL